VKGWTIKQGIIGKWWGRNEASGQYIQQAAIDAEKDVN